MKRHQVQTYAAMQKALAALLTDLDPARLEAELDESRGVGSLFNSRKAQLWDAYLAAWRAQSGGRAEGMMERFMILFGGFYDQAAE